MDRRLVEFKLTSKGLFELNERIEMQVECHSLLFSKNKSKSQNKRMDYNSYFDNYLCLISYEITTIKLCEEILYILNKDSGISFVIYLYLHKDINGLVKINFSELSKRFKVSRVHMLRLVKCAEEKNHLERENAGFYSLRPHFIKELHGYLSLVFLNYFHCLGYGY
ncbi:TPA: hypothetical protein ACXNPR_004274 [Enterobacter cancerogenus]